MTEDEIDELCERLVQAGWDKNLVRELGLAIERAIERSTEPIERVARALLTALRAEAEDRKEAAR